MPAGWSRLPLWSVAPRVAEKGHPDSPPLSVYLERGVVPRTEALDNHNRLGADLAAYLRVRRGDLVFNKLRTWQGGLGVSGYDGLVSPAYFVCRPVPSVEPRFLHFLLRSAPYLAELTRLSKWMPPSQFDIPWDSLRSLPVLLPPVDDQRRIADFLDDQVALLDHAIDLRQKQAALALERFRSFLADAVLGQYAGVRTRLRNMFEYERNGIWGGEPDGGPDDITCVRVADFDRLSFRATVAPTMRNVPIGQRQPRLLRRGDVLLEKSGGTADKPVGCAVSFESDAPAVCSNFVAVLRPRDGVVPEFAGFVMAACYQSRLNGPFVNQTTGIQNLDSAAYLRLPIVLPSLGEQQQRVRHVLAERSKCERLLSLYTTQSALLRDRKKALITSAVTGEFDVSTARRVA